MGWDGVVGYGNLVPRAGNEVMRDRWREYTLWGIWNYQKRSVLQKRDRFTKDRHSRVLCPTWKGPQADLHLSGVQVVPPDSHG